MIFRRLVVLGSMLIGVAFVHAQPTVPALLQTIPGVIVSPVGGIATFDLRSYLGLPSVTGQIAQWDTTLGKYNVELLAGAAPVTVANFLRYVNAGYYNNTIFHQSVPEHYLEGGVVKRSLNTETIPQFGNISPEVYWSNIRGTLAMTKNSPTDPNSQTSGWLFNTGDNSAVFDTSNGGYTVFGRVLGSGMAVVDALNKISTYSTGVFTSIPLIDSAVGQTIVLANFVVVNSIRTLPLYPTASSSDAVLSLAIISNTNSSIASIGLSGSALVINPLVTNGTTNVTVRVTDTNGNFVDGVVAVSVVPQAAPNITQQPASLTMPAGSTAIFTVTAAANPSPFYQWRKNGADIAGANEPVLMLRNISSADAATYTVNIVNLQGLTTSSGAILTVTGASSTPGRLVNLSARTGSGAGTQVLNVGYVIGGTGTTGSIPVLIRGLGPALVPYGLSPNIILADPAISLVRQSNGVATLAANDNWGGDSQITATSAAVGAVPLPAANSKDAALLSTLSPNVYTVIVSGVSNTTGQTLAEIYDATANAAYTATTPRLVNISARAQVNTGDDILIAGFVIGGTTPRTVLIRGVGPTLSNYGVTTGFLADPRLSLYRTENASSALIASNDNWGASSAIASAASQVGAFSLTSANEAVLLLTLQPGIYTAQVNGMNSTTGIALVEVYEVY